MNQDTQQDPRGVQTQYPCAFGKALLARCAVCELAELRAYAEIQTVVCSMPPAHARCVALRQLLRTKSVFALKQPDTAAAMPHALAMKLECGGLRGMHQVLDIQGTVPDIQQLHSVARARFASLADLPFEPIVGSVVHWQGRRRMGPPAGPAEEH